MLTIVPSRGRPQNIARLVDAWSTAEISDLLVVCDEDDPEVARYLPLVGRRGVSLTITPPLGGLGPTLNFYAVLHETDHTVIAFMGDDHVPRTQGWDTRLLTECRNGGIAYGDDLFQRQNLPTAVAMDARIIHALGFMVPPGITHLYIDNFWKELGLALGTLHYLSDVVIEHVHPAAGGKAPDDERYAFVNSTAMWHHDGIAYETYMNNHFWDDVRKVKEALA